MVILISSMKTIFIVGASSGIGYATAAKFLKSGYKVINASRTPCNLPGVTNLICDVTVRERLDEILSEVKKEQINCFVYSAGFSMAAPLEYALEGDYRYLYEVNLFAFIHCVQTLLPVLRSSMGTIVAVSSLAAMLPIPYDAYYTSSKSALNAFVECLSYELDPIKIYSVMPGGTKTGFTAKRKIYPPPMIDGYAKELQEAADKLASTEQNGVCPEKVAKTIFDICTEQPCTTVKSACLVNKLAHIMAKLMPSNLKKALISMYYFTEEE